MDNSKKYFTIGEIASAHDGDHNEFLNILKTYLDKGLDFIKFQVFNVEKLVNTNDINNSPLKKIEINEFDWRNIFQHIENESNIFEKVRLIAEPYDLSSLKLCSEYNIFDSYKLPTSDLSNLKLIKEILKYTSNLFIGTGGSTFEEITKTIKFIKQNYSNVNINLIHGFQAYPTKIEDMDLWKIDYLKKTFSLKVGFADHADASSQILRYLPSCIALATGADFIEKHITMDRNQEKPDFYSSLNPDEIEDFLFSLDQTIHLLTKSKKFDLSENESYYRKTMKKFACSSTIIKMGEKISLDNITFKRSNKGSYSIFDLDFLIGKVAKNNLPIGHTFSPEDLL